MDTETLTLLSAVYNRLNKTDLSSMIFLCGDDIPASEAEKIKTALQLFTFLEKIGKIKKTDLSYLKELLHIIQRIDILENQLQTDAADMATNTTYISKYRRLLYKLAGKTETLDIQTISYLHHKGATDSNNSNMMELFLQMEKSGHLKEDNLEYLKEIYGKANRRDLVSEIQQFENQCQDSKQENATNENTPQMHAVQETNPCEAYELNKNPHGWCLIINNYNFSEARTLNIEMSDRRGSDRDAGEIHKVFRSRNYIIKHLDNLKGEDMLKVMKKYAKMDHGDKDSFVCFLLSHGGLGVIHGTDGSEIQISKLTECFNNQHCSSLIGKPKIFFIQACRGSELQKPVFEADFSAREYTFDAGTSSLPAHSDFFTAYSTVEDYKSLRDPKNGSIYMQFLCATLNDYKLYRTDLESILTIVHRKISESDYYLPEYQGGPKVHAKQMPSVNSELRKALILPAPSLKTQPTG
uniref:Caspase-8 n=1 Tax=Leptobrachium leishanense TaxID=445787 RepID=A0A8C5Q2D1_9ANUR